MLEWEGVSRGHTQLGQQTDQLAKKSWRLLGLLGEMGPVCTSKLDDLPLHSRLSLICKFTSSQ